MSTPKPSRLSAEEARFFRALGVLTVNFQTLERTIIAAFQGLVNPDADVATAIASRMSFGVLRDVCKALFRRLVDNEDHQERFVGLLNRADEIESERNVFIHSVYARRSPNPADTLVRFKPKVKRGWFVVDDEDVDVERLEELGLEILQLVIEIAHFLAELEENEALPYPTSDYFGPVQRL